MNTDQAILSFAINADALHVEHLPPNFFLMPKDRRLEVAALSACRLKARTDKKARDFCRQYASRLDNVPTLSTDKRFRVGVVTPVLAQIGGVESWIRSFVRIDTDAVRCSGVACTSSWGLSAKTVRAISNTVPVTIGGDAADTLADQSDVLIVWGRPDFCVQKEMPLVWIAHGCCNWTRRIVSNAGGLRVGVSQPAADAFPTDGAQANVIWNGVDPARTAYRGSREQARAEIGLAPNDTAILYVGRFSKEKRPDDVVRAAAVCGGVPVLVGRGRDTEQFEATMREICPRVIFPGPLDPPAIAYRACDVLVSSSPAEGGPLVVSEAWLAGIPVVSTPVGVIPEAEAKFGRLTSSIRVGATGQEIAAACTAAMDHPEIADRARAVARKWFTERAFLARWSQYLTDRQGNI